MKNTKNTIAHKVAARFGGDGLCWTDEGGNHLADVCESRPHTIEEVEVRDGDQTWTVCAWTFGDGSQIAEVVEGGWDVLDDFTRIGSVILLDARAP